MRKKLSLILTLIICLTTGWPTPAVQAEEEECEHTFDYETVEEATCTEPGYVIGECGRCGKFEDYETEPLGHDYVDGICSRCGVEAEQFFSGVFFYIEARETITELPLTGALFAACPVSTYGSTVFTECEPTDPLYGITAEFADEQVFDERYLYGVSYSTENPESAPGEYVIEIQNAIEGWYAIYEWTAPGGHLKDEDPVWLVYVDNKESFSSNFGVRRIGLFNQGNYYWPAETTWEEQLIFNHEPEPEPIIEPLYEDSDFYEEYISGDSNFLDYMETEDFAEVLAEIGETDFSLKHLLVIGDIVDPENELGAFEDIHFLGYDSEEETAAAFAYYDFYNENVISDTIVFACDSDPDSPSLFQINDDNAFSLLKISISDLPVEHYDIALLDSGVNDNNIPRYSVLGDSGNDVCGHGSNMLSRIRNQNPNANIVSVKVLHDDSIGTVAEICSGILFTTFLDVTIINLSLGTFDPIPEDIDFYNAVISRVAYQGKTIFAAAGNKSTNVSRFAPGGTCPDVITVGACYQDGYPTEISNYGELVDYYVHLDNYEYTSGATATLSGLYSLYHSLDDLVDYVTVFPGGTVDISETSVSGLQDRTFQKYGHSNLPDEVLTWNGRTLQKYKDYTVSLTNLDDPDLLSLANSVGTIQVTITGIGHFSGNIYAYYEISPAEISEANVTLPNTSVYYCGKEITHTLSGYKKLSPTVRDNQNHILRENLDYSVSFVNNKDTGVATIQITGIGNFNGLAEKTFTILPIQISKISVLVRKADYQYTSNEIRPLITVRSGFSSLPASDYTVKYQNNINCGTATVIVTGNGRNLTGSKTLTFTISPRDMTGWHINWKNGNTYSFTGNAVCPLDYALILESLDRKIYAGTDYTTEYSNNVNAGTATVLIRGIGNYTGEFTDSFSITSVPITSVTIPHTSMVYTGTARTMTNATVVKSKVNGIEKTLTRGTDYKISYANNTEIGTACMTVTGKGNYNGTITKTFKILPKPTTLASVTSLFTGELLIVWNAQTQETSGYQVQYSTSSDFSSDAQTASVFGNTNTSKTIRNLFAMSSGTRYYARVRTFKTVDNVRYYSSWSSAKSTIVT